MRKSYLVGGVVSVLAVAVGAALAYRSWQAEQERLAAIEADRPAAIHREAVKERLNDPDSAVFRSVVQSKRDPEVWCGEVNARNRMGGMVGFTRYVAVVEQDRELKVLDKITFEPLDPAGRDAFEKRWSLLCLR